MSLVEGSLTSAMSVRGRAFWLGFPALVLAFVVAQVLAQIDLMMLGRQAPGMPAAYVMLTRLALVDLLAVMALGSVVSVWVARAVRNADAAPVIRWALTLAAGVGLVLSGLAWAVYPHLIPYLAGDDAELRQMIRSAIPWFAAAAPLRLLNGCGAFVLHATQQGRRVVRWKLWELLAKVLLNLLLIEVLGYGFAGCFMASLLMQLGSAAWLLHHLRRQVGAGPWLPSWPWARSVLAQSAWEGQRLLSMQLLGLVTLALFASPRIAQVDAQRLDGFAAGTVLALLVFSPLVALIRFLAMRFAGLGATEVRRLLGELWRLGVPIMALLAVLLSVVAPGLGLLVYGQQGTWWTTFVVMLALSLPLRLVTNTLRAALQSQGAFVGLAKVDSLLGWGVGLPLLVLGLHLQAPAIAYSYLLVPEGLALLWLAASFRRLGSGRPQKREHPDA